MNTSDTIAAPATAIGGAVTIIRIAGPGALTAGNTVWHGRRPLSGADARKMQLGKIGGDPALAVYMPGPHSYTGDDVVELQCHGGAAAANAALRAAFAAGCRLAEPGEFTFRAFVNGKLDLLQSEAVADLVSSGSEAALALAERQLAGTLSEKLNSVIDRIDDLRSECEARLDFPDEDLDFSSGIAAEISALRVELHRLLATRSLGDSLRGGVRVVLAGRPNAGKSSLLNRLAGFDRAIVSAIPGTTRDTVECDAVLRGIPVKLIDTAGLRESTDAVEQLGIERSRRSIAAAQITFWVLDPTGDLDAETAEFNQLAPPGAIAVWNKSDLVPEMRLPEPATETVRMSARTGANLDELLDAFGRTLCAAEHPEPPEVAVNARCAAALESADRSLEQASGQFISANFELAAAELATAAHAIGTTVGRTADPDLLDRVFQNFCIGK